MTAACVRSTSFRFDLRAGEILGVAGVDGNGQRELGEVIAGLRPLQAGQIRVHGRDISDLGIRQRRTVAGIGFVPEDRQGTGLVLDYAASENLILRDFDRRRSPACGILNFGLIRRQRRRADPQRYDMRLRSPAASRSASFPAATSRRSILAREIEASTAHPGHHAGLQGP